MINNQIILSGITPGDLIELLRPMVHEEVKQVKSEMPEQLLSPSETCKMFQPPISKVTLKAWTDQGKLQDHRIGGRVYYKASEVLTGLTTLRKYQGSKN